MNDERQAIRALVRGAYDLQRQRIPAGGRVISNFRAKLGLDEGATTTEAKEMLKELERRFRLITDDVVEITRRRKTYAYDGVISNFAELTLVSAYLMMRDNEGRAFKYVQYAVEDHPLWSAFLKGVKGCGPAMAGVILSEIDIHKARHVSSLWRYAGLDVAPDGRGRSRRADHLIDVEYDAADGTRKTRKSITYNPFLKTKLLGVLAGGLLKAADPVYRPVYDDYRHRVDSRPDLLEASNGHKHNMAMRYMIKRFLADLYRVWRGLEGLPVDPEYSEAKLGLVHGA